MYNGKIQNILHINYSHLFGKNIITIRKIEYQIFDDILLFTTFSLKGLHIYFWLH